MKWTYRPLRSRLGNSHHHDPWYHQFTCNLGTDESLSRYCRYPIHDHSMRPMALEKYSEYPASIHIEEYEWCIMHWRTIVDGPFRAWRTFNVLSHRAMDFLAYYPVVLFFRYFQEWAWVWLPTTVTHHSLRTCRCIMLPIWPFIHFRWALKLEAWSRYVLLRNRAMYIASYSFCCGILHSDSISFYGISE